MRKVITYGSYDLFHEGHYRLLKRAKELGDYLIVGITTEQYDFKRGKMNVSDSLITRIDNVRACGFADEIIIEDHEGQKLEDIQKYGVDVFTVGSDWKGKFDYLREYCEVVYLERTKNISSTEKYLSTRGILRIGMVGCGRIASRFVPEAKYVSGAIVLGVYNPHGDSAASFARQFELAFSTREYDELLDKVDAVYIASPHETHYHYVKTALLAGRHVLCEKPMVFSRVQACELFALAKQRNLVLMEAVKTAYGSGFMNIIALAKGGRIGAIRDVEACFTKLETGKGVRREFTPETGGSFTELGTYPLLPIVKLLGHDYDSLRFESIRDENGLDLYTKAYISYPHGMAAAKCGLGVKSEGQLLISGTEGYILVESPWWLTQTFEICYEDRRRNEKYFAKWDGYGLRYEISDFVKAVKNERQDNFKFSAEDSIAVAGIMEAFLAHRRNKAIA